MLPTTQKAYEEGVFPYLKALDKVDRTPQQKIAI